MELGAIEFKITKFLLTVEVRDLSNDLFFKASIRL